MIGLLRLLLVEHRSSFLWRRVDVYCIQVDVLRFDLNRKIKEERLVRMERDRQLE